MKQHDDVFAPVSTYRVQFNGDFTFRHLEEQLDYLQELGITTIYASPVFEAVPGSTHGYDVTDPHSINPAIGTLEEWRALHKKLQARGISWIQDIVPNHMALHPSNSRLMDVLERGPLSPYYRYFDIDWEYPDAALHGRLMLPFLDKSPEACLSAKEIKLVYAPGGWKVQNGMLEFPLSVSAYDVLLGMLTDAGADIRQLLCGLKRRAVRHVSPAEWQEQKHMLFAGVKEQRLQQLAAKVNGDKVLLASLLENQYYTFTHWQEAEERINYRRFFTINGLICLRMEDRQVFDEYHVLLHQLYTEGLVQGFRIDHIDGLQDPGRYVGRLRELLGNSCYIIAEKILAGHETLPREWPLQGTTGYEFLGDVSQLLTERMGFEMIGRFYRSRFPQLCGYERLVNAKKQLILQTQLHGEWDNLVRYAYELGLVPPGVAVQDLKAALGLFMVHLPVYRVYPERWPLSTRSISLLDYALNGALRANPALSKAIDVIYSWWQRGGSEAALRFLQRVMQFTGPLTAKGVEDTAFYVYNALISHNEVGDAPEGNRCSLPLFHERAQLRQRFYPLALNTTATHDTKRGEDARIRLNTLTLHPHQWIQQVQHWHAMNGEWVTVEAGQPAPDMNEEYFIYQSIIGGFPPDGVITEEFVNRVSDYFVKVLREARVHSSWSDPDEAYEQACLRFIRGILKADGPFVESLRAFLEQPLQQAAVYSLTQTLVKITTPGVPDIYQGCELWDLSFVDPDNRRPVDYALRRQELAILRQLEKEGTKLLLAYLQEHRLLGAEKLYVTWKALHARRERAALFSKGAYLPLYSNDGQDVIAYARRYEDQWCVVLAPLLSQVPPGKADSRQLVLPEGAPAVWRHVFTGEEILAEEGCLPPGILERFPVAMLVS